MQYCNVQRHDLDRNCDLLSLQAALGARCRVDRRIWDKECRMMTKMHSRGHFLGHEKEPARMKWSANKEDESEHRIGFIVGSLFLHSWSGSVIRGIPLSSFFIRGIRGSLFFLHPWSGSVIRVIPSSFFIRGPALPSVGFPLLSSSVVRLCHRWVLSSAATVRRRPRFTLRKSPQWGQFERLPSGSSAGS